MKRLLFLAVLFVMVPQILTAQVGSLEFNSSNYVDSQITAEEFDPQIVIDENNESYDLVFTRMAGPYLYQPYPDLATQGQMGWSVNDIQPYANAEYLCSQIQMTGSDQVISFRGYSNFTSNNYRSVGSWYVWLDPDNLQHDHDGSFSYDLISFRDYLNSSDEIHYLSVSTLNSIPQLDYYYRDGSGGYHSDAGIVSSSQLRIGLSDMTIGYNDTPYFCFRDGNNLKVLPYEGNPVTITGLYSMDNGNWNNKLPKDTPPSIAYNPTSGVTMVIYTDYDESEMLWRLYFSEKPSGTNQWSSPQLVYENTTNSLNPRIVPDNSSADFLVGFYSIESNNHVHLNALRYSDERETFWDTPLYVSDVGNINNSGQNLYYGRPLDVKVLPWENTTALLISTITFESGTDTDVKIYSVNVPATSSYTFRNIVVDEDAGGNLKLTNLNSQSSETFISGSSRSLNLDTDYSIETLPGRVEDYIYNGQTGDYQHHDWDEDDSRYQLIDEFNPQHYIHEKDAFYYKYNSVTLSGADELEIDDPWYFDPSTHNQSSGFRTISSGSYSGVFTNQNEQFEPSIPIYNLRAPELIDDGNGSYSVFRRWIGTNVDFGSGTITSNRQTPVVFTASGASATAQYNTLSVTGPATLWAEGDDVYIQTPLNTTISNHSFTKLTPSHSAGVTMTAVSAPEGYSKYRLTVNYNASITYNASAISSGETVVVTSSFQNIPAGTWVGLPSGASVQIQDYSKFQGTSSQPIVLRGMSGAVWNGLSLSNMNNGETLEHVVVKQTRAALHPLDNVTRIRIANVTVDSAQFGFASNTELTGLIALDQMEFLNIDSAGVFSASDEDYLADTLRITNSSFSPATAGRGNAIQVIPAYTEVDPKNWTVA